MSETVFRAKILVVDDLPEKRLVYHSILEELGVEILSVSSGAEALKQVLRHDFAVILLDVHMPDIDGFETARLIRQRRRSGGTPIIFLTAFTDEMRTAEGYATGAVDYLATPVVPEILRAKVRVFVEMYQLRSQMALQAEQEALRTAADENARRFALLAEVSRSLANSLDLDAVHAEVARMCLPGLSDFCVAALENGQGGRGRIRWAGTGPDGVAFSGTIDGTRSLDGWFGDAIDSVLRSEKSEIHSRLPASAPLVIRGEVGTAIDVIASAASILVLPLEARGRVLGVLAISLITPERRWSESELALIRELTARAGIGLDNAILVDHIREKDRLKNEFLAMLAHELRNPLAPIRNALPMLELAAGNPAKLGWLKDLIGRQVNHLVRLVDDLLDISRITERKVRLDLRDLDLSEIVAAAVETSRPHIEAQGHKLSIAMPDPNLRLRADATRMAQVLSNLLNNSAKYTPPGGQIKLLAERFDHQVLIRVRDTGIGIPQDMLVRVFELFTQVDRSLDRSQGGLGIGLTLVRELVAMHGGTVEVRSDGANRGSEFTVRLPLLREDVESTAERANPISPSSPGIKRRILVVDDNRDAADSLALLLEMDGHEVRTAYSGPDGLQSAAAFKPDAVLLDIGLPGLSGYEVARKLRGGSERESGMQIIAISGYGTESDRKISREAGFHHHLTKPVEYQKLKELLTAGTPCG